VVALVRVEAIDVDAGSEHLEGGVGRGLVEHVPLLHLMAGAGDHEVGVAQHALLDGDAVRESVAGLHRVRVDAGATEDVALVAPEAVAREHERHAEAGGELACHVAGVGVVAVHEVRRTSLVAEEPQRLGHQLVEVGPEELLAPVAAATAAQPHDAGAALAVERLEFAVVVVGGMGIVDAAGDEVDGLHLGSARQGRRQLDDVLRLAAGVGVAPEFEFPSPDQAMHAQHDDVETWTPEVADVGAGF
jgi:hypothetical protein